MKVELNQDAVDAIFTSILIEDYKMLKHDTERLEEAKELKPHQKEDLKANKKYLKAMKKLMPYYIGFDWKTRLNDDKPTEDIPDEL
jgi:hypothetical protein